MAAVKAKSRKPAVEEAIARASRDLDILVRPINVSMLRYSLNHANTHAAIRVARKRLIEAEGYAGLERIKRRKQEITLTHYLEKAEKRYPGILKAILASRNLASVARRYPSPIHPREKLTRARVSQLFRYLRELAVMRKTTLSGLVGRLTAP